MARLALDGLEKRFGKVTAVSKVDLDVSHGELICLLGPSGSGKSTVLRMIGGFEAPTAGRIRIDDEDVSSHPPERRPTAMVFQSHALWTHMDVFDNIAYGLKLRGLGRAAVREKVEGALALVGLAGYGPRGTRQLSGGQQQRVAIARCLVLEPKILLMDEPFASLDQHLRERLREEVRSIQRKLGITTIFVTHGQDEALALADRIVVMADGAVQQVGRPGDIYADPRTLFVAGFIGVMNRIAGTVADGRFRAGGFVVPAPIPAGPAILAVRPEDLDVAGEGGAPGHVTRVVDFGAYAVADVEADGMTDEVGLPRVLKLHVDRNRRFDKGDVVGLSPRRYALFRDGLRAHQHDPRSDGSDGSEARGTRRAVVDAG